MVRIAPVRLSFNPKTLWFDANGLDLSVGDAVVVKTARGREFGSVSAALFDMDYEDTKKLRSPLKPVERKASEEDRARNEEVAELSRLALPIFRQMAYESAPDMNPVAVEYLFEGDKAVFYFDSEERVDFRDLVRKLAAEFHVRVDMKQIGVRDGARMVGGLGHCGQELCCRRLGGEFNPVSIRMAKEQDLSLNPQKISGTCGRLMCCLRYEYDAYKDFHGRAPKKNARVNTPDGEGKVVDLDVPREIVSIKVGEDKPVKVPLADMEPAEEGARPNAVGDEAWQRANEPVVFVPDSALSLFTNELTGEDKLAQPGAVRHVHGESAAKGPRRTRRRGGSGRKKAEGAREQAGKEQSSTSRKPRRRRSTTVSSDGSAQTERQQKQGAEPASRSADAKEQSGQQKPQSSRRRRNRSGSGKKQQAAGAQAAGAERQQGASQVGRNSSALRAKRQEGATGAGAGTGADPAASAQAKGEGASRGSRRRRRSHKTNTTESDQGA